MHVFNMQRVEEFRGGASDWHLSGAPLWNKSDIGQAGAGHLAAEI
jgi:hypothetical protein